MRDDVSQEDSISWALKLTEHEGIFGSCAVARVLASRTRSVWNSCIVEVFGFLLLEVVVACVEKKVSVGQGAMNDGYQTSRSEQTHGRKNSLLISLCHCFTELWNRYHMHIVLH